MNKFLALSLSTNLVMLVYMIVAKPQPTGTAQGPEIQLSTSPEIRSAPELVKETSGAEPLVSESEPIQEGWLRVDTQSLTRLNVSSIVWSSTFSLSPEIREILKISDVTHEAFQRMSEKLFKGVLDAENDRTAVISEGGGIAYFGIPPLPDAIDSFIHEWKQSMSDILPKESVEIISSIYSQDLDVLRTTERQLSISQNNQGYNLHMTEIENGETRVSSHFALGIDGTGENTLERFLHISKIAESVLPFIDQNVNVEK